MTPRRDPDPFQGPGRKLSGVVDGTPTGLRCERICPQLVARQADVLAHLTTHRSITQGRLWDGDIRARRSALNSLVRLS